MGSSGTWIIKLPASATTYKVSNGALIVKKTMYVEGTVLDYSSTTIKGGRDGSVFTIPSSLPESISVNIRYMRITDSQDLQAYGGAVGIGSPSSGLTTSVSLYKVQIDNCIAWEGGAVSNYGASLTVNESYLHQNKATGGGAINSARVNGAGSLTLKNSKLQLNRADQNAGSGSGGALYITSQALIKHSTIDSNTAVDSMWGGDGGGIYIAGNGSVDVDYSTVSNNSGRSGGGMYEAHPAALRTHNTTVSGNVAAISGGGIWASNYLEMFNTTVAKNRAYTGNGGGVFFQSASSGARTNACIISDNNIGLAVMTPQDYQGAPHNSGGSDARSLFGVASGATGLVTSGANKDLIGGANLGILFNNGGPTLTHAIGTNSAAYNAEVSNLSPLATDQRGTARPQGAANDLGAFEYKP